eukprot:1900682-Amphidinium_carterae.2
MMIRFISSMQGYRYSSWNQVQAPIPRTLKSQLPESSHTGWCWVAWELLTFHVWSLRCEVLQLVSLVEESEH